MLDPFKSAYSLVQGHQFGWHSFLKAQQLDRVLHRLFNFQGKHDMIMRQAVPKRALAEDPANRLQAINLQNMTLKSTFHGTQARLLPFLHRAWMIAAKSCHTYKRTTQS